MIRGIAIFFALFFGLAALLFWAKMKPAGALELSTEIHGTHQ